MVTEAYNLDNVMFADLTKFFNIKNSLTKVFLILSFFGMVAFADLLIPTASPATRTDYIIKLVFTLITSATVFYIIHYGFGIVISNPINFLISTLIVFLLIHPTNSLWIFPFSIVAIALGKFMFRKNKQPIFNPAAMAITQTYLVTKVLQFINPHSDTLLISWWGTDMFQNVTKDIPILNVVIPVSFFLLLFYGASLFKKIPYILSFLLSFIVVTFAYTFLTFSPERAVSFISLTLFNATAFCALVMLPEPKTSPNFQGQQIVVGIIAGLSLFIFNTFLGTLPVDPLINTILVANICTLGIKMIKLKPKPATKIASPSNPVPVVPNSQTLAELNGK